MPGTQCRDRANEMKLEALAELSDPDKSGLDNYPLSEAVRDNYRV